MNTTIGTVLLALLVTASCSSGPTPWEAHGEAEWSQQTQLFKLTTSMDDVIEGYNSRYDYLTDSFDAPDDCALVEELATSDLMMVGQTATMDGSNMRKIQDHSTGEVLAGGDWMELNNCP